MCLTTIFCKQLKIYTNFQKLKKLYSCQTQIGFTKLGSAVYRLRVTAIFFRQKMVLVTLYRLYYMQQCFHERFQVYSTPIQDNKVKRKLECQTLHQTTQRSTAERIQNILIWCVLFSKFFSKKEKLDMKSKENMLVGPLKVQFVSGTSVPKITNKRRKHNSSKMENSSEVTNASSTEKVELILMNIFLVKYRVFH